MDIQAYIESGIIESYVLGLAGAEEANELEMLCIQYPEIKNAVNKFEILIEKHVFENAVAPPADMKQTLIIELADEFTEEADKKEAVIIPFQTTDANTALNKVHSQSMWKYAAAASIVLLVVSATFNFYYYNNYQTANAQYQALLVERNSLQANNEVFRTKLSGFEQSITLIGDTNMLAVRLNPVAGKENNVATVFWNNKTKDVYIISSKLAPAPAGKQYQLWALVDGKPVDAGLIESDCNGVCKMTNTQRAEKFAITLEDKGGSPSPHLDQLFVISKDI